MSTTNERSQNDIVVGDGVVTVIPFQFNYFSDSNISVLVTLRDETDPDNIVETELVEVTDYTLYDDRIELTNPLLVDQFLLVERIVKDVQPLDYDDLRPFPEEIHERQEDRTFMSLSEIKNRFKRTPMFNKFNDYEIAIEDPVDGNYLKFTYDPVNDVWSISNDESVVDLSNYYTKSEVDALDQSLQNQIDNITGSLVSSVNTRTGDVVLDASDVGLDQVDNTSDADKPISIATQSALDEKLKIANLQAGTNISITGAGTDVDPLVVNASGSVSVEWGDLTGTLSDQNDLYNALLNKEDTANKVANISIPNNTTFPTTLAVKDALDALTLSLFPVGMLMSTLGDHPPNNLNWLKLHSHTGFALDPVVHADLIQYLDDNNLIFDDPPETYVELFRRDTYSGIVTCQGMSALSPRGYGTRALFSVDKEGPDYGMVQEDQMQRIMGSSGNNDDDQIRGAGNMGANASGAFSWSGSSTYSYSGYNSSGGSARRILNFDSRMSPNARTSLNTNGETRANTFGVYWWIRY